MTAEPSPPLTIGVIGTGDIVRSVHFPVLLARRDVRIGWITDVDAVRAEAVGKAYKVPVRRLPRDFGELPDADVVLLTAPYGVRDPYYRALRHRDIAIYAEKPVALSCEYLKQLTNWYPDYALASGLMMRAWGPVACLKQLVASGIFGSLREISFGFGRPGFVTHDRFYLNRQQGGAGLLGELGIHGLDCLLHISGAKEVSVEAHTGVRHEAIELHTEAVLSITTEFGYLVHGRVTVTGVENALEGLHLEFDQVRLSLLLPGQGYALVGDSTDQVIHIRHRQGGRSYTLAPDKGRMLPQTKMQMFDANWSDFLKGVRSRTANRTSAKASTLTVEVLEQLDRAS